MGDRSQIQWTDATWNPVTGCAKVSPGCAHCYAETIAKRLWRTTYPPVIEMRHDPTISAVAEFDRPRRFEDVQCHEDRLDQPLRWKKPRRIFVNSMSDLFHEAVPDAFIDKVFAVMALARQHTFQMLTKRPERMRDYLLTLTGSVERMDDLEYAAVEIGDSTCAAGALEDRGWPLPNVWLGVSVENQRFADERIPLLLQTPAAVRFISAEPLIGPIDLHSPVLEADSDDYLDWVIVGGESGKDARPCAMEWVESIVGQCRAAGVAVYVKQLGAYVVSEQRTAPLDHFSDPASPKLLLAPNGEAWAWRAGLHDSHGGDPSEWPADLRVREFPQLRLMENRH